MPVIGTDSRAKGKVVLYHNGGAAGYSSSVHLIPETDTVVVVLCNAMGLSDAGDFVGQLVLEAVFGAQSRNNFARLATRLREAGLKVYEDPTAEVEKGKTSRPFSQSLEAYRGRYVNRAGNFVLDIALNEAEECLHMMLQSMRTSSMSFARMMAIHSIGQSIAKRSCVDSRCSLGHG
ncbi:MAG: hypothetical protein MMC23_007312 [Stictis urceolatum]|nr:hypothetical protein [Stictis urceolata]